jgi:CBS domain-containing protein
MISAAESLFGPYRWGRYDLIILPPSFPFGGMENPRLTFATPTVIAGDKSLVSLVAHELAHSWSGNLVTNATWRDFWLNEGFTSYCEQRIMEKVYGPERSRLEKQLAMSDLEKELGDLEDWPGGAARRARQPASRRRLLGRALPEGGAVPAAAGGAVRRARFDAFLRAYFDAHAFRSITTDEFVAYLQRNLLASDPAKAASLDLDRWLNKPGLPPDAPRPRAPAWPWWMLSASASWPAPPPRQLDTRGWVSQQWQHFIQGLPADISTARLADLDATFKFTASGNSEILADWLVVAIRRGYRPRRRPAGGIPAERRPPQVPETALHRAGEIRARPAARPGHLREGAPPLPRRGHRHDRQDPHLALKRQPGWPAAPAGRMYLRNKRRCLMKIATLMTTHVATVRMDEPLSIAAERMWTRDCGVLPVIDTDERVVGMVTDRDICMSTWMNGCAPQALNVATAMSRSLHSCSPDDSLDSAEQLMRENQIRRLPVVDRGGKLVGILSLADIVREAQRERARGQKDVAPTEVTATLANICEPVVELGLGPRQSDGHSRARQ